MDAGIDPITRDLSGERIDTLANAVYLRLEIPLGQWWADPRVGSRLYELQRQKDLTRVAKLAEQYAAQALQPLLDDGRASAIKVSTDRAAGRLVLHVEVSDGGGRTHTFVHPVEVI